MTRKLALPLGALLLSACPAYEGPIDVILIDMDDTAVIEWAEAGSDAFEKCTNNTTDPEAVVGCGPYGVGAPGRYTVRVTWQGVEVEQDVTLERDGDYEANVAITFEASAFVE